MVWHMYFIGVNIINRTLPGRFRETKFPLSCLRNLSIVRCAHSWTHSWTHSTLEEKFCISALPCNILYLLKTESLGNAILELWLAWPSWYMSHYTILSKYGNCTRLLKVKNKLKIGCFTKSGRILDILTAFLIKQLFHSRLLDTIWL